MHQENASATPPPAPLPSPGPHTGALRPHPALLLACGNTLRQDDGVGCRVAQAAEKLFPPSQLRVLTVQQFAPELAADLAEADLAIFIDASAIDEPGSIRMVQLEDRQCVAPPPLETHRLDPPALLALARSLCGRAPAHAFLLTIGASQFGYGETLSRSLERAVPRAVRLLASVLAAFSARN